MPDHGTITNIALTHNNDIVSCLSYRIEDNVYIIENWCNKINTEIVSGFSKLINFILLQAPEGGIRQIKYYIDLRYENKNELFVEGFRSVADELKYNILNDGTKIWDAGQRLYIKTL